MEDQEFVTVEFNTEKEQSELENLVDQFGELSDDLEVAKKVIKKADGIRKKILSFVDQTVEAESKTQVEGSEWTVELTSKTEERKLNGDEAKALIHKAIGNDAFVSLCNFRISDLEKVCTAPELDKILVKERTGSRRIRVIKK